MRSRSVSEKYADQLKPPEVIALVRPTSYWLITLARSETGDMSCQNFENACDSTSHGRKATKKLCTCGCTRREAVRPQKSAGRSAIASKISR